MGYFEAASQIVGIALCVYVIAQEGVARGRRYSLKDEGYGQLGLAEGYAGADEIGCAGAAARGVGNDVGQPRDGPIRGGLPHDVGTQRLVLVAVQPTAPGQVVHASPVVAVISAQPGIDRVAGRTRNPRFNPFFVIARRQNSRPTRPYRAPALGRVASD